MENYYYDILELLKDNSRYTPAKIAAMLDLTAEQVNTAVEEMEKSGTIVKYTTLINNEHLDREIVEALIEVRVTPQKRRGFDAIAEDIYQFDQVKSVYLMSGGYDLTVVVEGKSLKEVAMFVSERLSTMDTVVSTATHFILKKYKTDGIIMEKPEDNGNRLAIHP